MLDCSKRAGLLQMSHTGKVVITAFVAASLVWMVATALWITKRPGPPKVLPPGFCIEGDHAIVQHGNVGKPQYFTCALGGSWENK